ncbi:restriction endonuclease subunit S [Vibrio pomeroyi]|uniref:Restriction endonuclease subunit S n=1 Tax=Vibrio pomeroyi TaxID=198832 RepID=A0ABV4N3F5_9VIBR
MKVENEKQSTVHSQLSIEGNMPKLRFGDFSGGLLVTRLSEIINKLESGVSVNSEDVPPNSNENGILKTSAIYAGSFNPEQAKVITDASELRRAKLNPKKDSIIISRMNTPALVGESGYISKDYPNLFIPDRLWQATVSSQHCTRWLSFLLTSPRTRFIISSKGTGTSNSMKNISKPSFLSIGAVTPTLPEQQKIASFLSKVDEKIGLLSDKKDKLTEYKRGVMQQMFNGKWHEQDGQLTFVPPTLRFKADDGSEFPDWEERTLKSVFSIFNGFAFKSTDSRTNGTRWLKIADVGVEKISNKNISFLPKDYLEKYKKFALKKGDVVVALTRPVLNEQLKIAFVDDHSDGALLNQRVGKVDTKECLIYVYYLAQCKRVVSSIIQNIAGTDPPNLAPTDINHIKITLPSLEEQKKIANFLSAIDQKIALTNSELNKAKEWKKGLLQQMFV